jgi:hypothetical protein
MPTRATQGLTGCAMLLVAQASSWWTVLAVLGTTFGILGYRLLAERGRRKTLEAAFLAPANTVVVLGEGSGGPPMWVWVGTGQQPACPLPGIEHVAGQSGACGPGGRRG